MSTIIGDCRMCNTWICTAGLDDAAARQSDRGEDLCGLELCVACAAKLRGQIAKAILNEIVKEGSWQGACEKYGVKP